MKTILSILALILTAGLTAQESKYNYKLILEDQPSKFVTLQDSSSSYNSLKFYITDFINKPLPFCTVTMITDARDTVYTTDVSGYLFSKPITNIYKLVITHPGYTMLEFYPQAQFNSKAKIIKVALTLKMASRSCDVISTKMLRNEEINQIAKEFSANPYDTKISENKTYFVICDCKR
jgi:hypothetical protein